MLTNKKGAERLLSVKQSKVQDPTNEGDQSNSSTTKSRNNACLQNMSSIHTIWLFQKEAQKGSNREMDEHMINWFWTHVIQCTRTKDRSISKNKMITAEIFKKETVKSYNFLIRKRTPTT